MRRGSLSHQPWDGSRPAAAKATKPSMSADGSLPLLNMLIFFLTSVCPGKCTMSICKGIFLWLRCQDRPTLGRTHLSATPILSSRVSRVGIVGPGTGDRDHLAQHVYHACWKIDASRQTTDNWWQDGHNWPAFQGQCNKPALERYLCNFLLIRYLPSPTLSQLPGWSDQSPGFFAQQHQLRNSGSWLFILQNYVGDLFRF